MIKDPFSTSFQALKTLCLVHELRSFSAAADKLDQNQSTVSYTIDILRKTFNDPLFIRQGHYINVTERCNDIVIKAKDLIIGFEVLLLEQPFNTAEAKGKVTISCNYYERAVLLPSILQNIRQEAPDLTIEIIASETNGAHQLQHGECDILLTPMSLDGEGIYRKRLCKDTYSCVVSSNNNIVTKELSLADYIKMNHLVIIHSGVWKPYYLQHLDKMGIELTPKMNIPSFDNLESFIIGTDLIATIPNRLAQHYSDKVSILPMPIEVATFSDMYWSTRTHKSHLFIWLRELILKSIS